MPWQPKILAHQLILSQLGGQIATSTPGFSDLPTALQLAGLMGLVNVNVGVVLLVYEMNYYVQADWVEIKNIPIARAWSLGQLVFSKKACI